MKRTGHCGRGPEARGLAGIPASLLVSGLCPHDVGQGCLVTAQQSPGASQRLNIQMGQKQDAAGYRESTHHPCPPLAPVSPLLSKWLDGDQEWKTLRSHRPADSIDEVDARIISAAPAQAARRGSRPRVARVPQGLKGRQNSDF